MSRYQEVDLSKVRTVALRDRENKVTVKDLVTVPTGGELNFPPLLKGRELKLLLERLRAAKAAGRPILWGMGGHVLKCGLSPLLLDLMEHGWVQGLAMNGSVSIHDTEMALVGATSEDVGANMVDGSFGMSAETAAFIERAVRLGKADGLGYGEALGQAILDEGLPHREVSLLAQACRRHIPATVHIALGTDIVHQHPGADGSAIGELSLRDFRIFCRLLTGLEGGCYLNWGSAVLLPEVFLKALTVARNLGHRVFDITTAVFDMNVHYRACENVCRRPTKDGGRGWYFVGHHELMLPLLHHFLRAEGT